MKTSLAFFLKFYHSYLPEKPRDLFSARNDFNLLQQSNTFRKTKTKIKALPLPQFPSMMCFPITEPAPFSCRPFHKSNSMTHMQNERWHVWNQANSSEVHIKHIVTYRHQLQQLHGIIDHKFLWRQRNGRELLSVRLKHILVTETDSSTPISHC